ncbi:XrtA/PEP-CTERM system exopolysaccharide export protein [Roseomonas sp. CAU 1739]|uniref:XrtA/PEP-CTERM system exopolysaccharide export protein n=1 Tax=Roseomonas sp. CAU 1739 TaxID=3140364 RepID=UPI00325AA20D
MSTKRRPMILVAALTVTLGACAQNTAIPADTASATRGPAPEYVIGPGDGLDIYVHRSPELTVNGLPVRPDGRISIPLVPDIEAAGRTPTQLSREMEDKLRRFVIDPNVTVIVRSFVGTSSQQVRVIGEATQPRALPYREGMTLLDIMIDARGLTRYAAGNRAEIIRRETAGSPRQVIPVRLSDLLRDGDMSQDIPIRPGDTLVIPQGWF